MYMPDMVQVLVEDLKRLFVTQMARVETNRETRSEQIPVADKFAALERLQSYDGLSCLLEGGNVLREKIQAFGMAKTRRPDRVKNDHLHTCPVGEIRELGGHERKVPGERVMTDPAGAWMAMQAAE